MLNAFVKRRSSVQARLAALQNQWFGALMARATGAVWGTKKTLYRTNSVQASDPYDDVFEPLRSVTC